MCPDSFLFNCKLIDLFVAQVSSWFDCRCSIMTSPCVCMSVLVSPCLILLLLRWESPSHAIFISLLRAWNIQLVSTHLQLWLRASRRRVCGAECRDLIRPLSCGTPAITSLWITKSEFKENRRKQSFRKINRYIHVYKCVCVCVEEETLATPDGKLDRNPLWAGWRGLETWTWRQWSYFSASFFDR